jgi:hypothetical protein
LVFRWFPALEPDRRFSFTQSGMPLPQLDQDKKRYWIRVKCALERVFDGYWLV